MSEDNQDLLTDRFDENRYTYLLLYDSLLLRCLSTVLHELRVALLMLVDSINARCYVRLLISSLHLLPHLAATLGTTGKRRVLGCGLAVTDHLL